ncbi:MAG: serine hydrolase domain-containing protein [Polyangiaceae bacterium]
MMSANGFVRLVALSSLCALVGCTAVDVASESEAPGEEAAGAAVQPCHALPDPVQIFEWTPAERVVGMSHSEDIYATESFHRSIFPASFLPKLPAPVVKYQYGGQLRTIDDYMTRENATGLLVMKDGKIVIEKYRGINDSTLWQSNSIAKSVVSTLVGIALKEGKISSLDDGIELYVPEVIGSAYEGVTIRNMLRMASGVAWVEDEYEDPATDANYVLSTCIGERIPDCTLDRLLSLPRVADQGTVWNYNTGEAHLLGLVVQRATGKSLAKYLEQKVWKPMRAEHDGAWIRESDNGPSFGGIGFNATLRDYGRFGQFILNNGALPNGSNPLPANWVQDATTWFAPSAIPGFADNGQYGYMWWFYPAYDDGINNPSPLQTKTGNAPLQRTTGSAPVPITGHTSDWSFAGYGIYGQMIAINPIEKIVMVQFAAWDHANPVDLSEFPDNPYNEEGVFLNAVIDALHK